MKVVSKYEGIVKLPDGRKVEFTVKGTSQSEVRSLLQNAQPGAKIRLKKKTKKK